MAVRLQTAKGEIKEYQTVYGVGSCIGDASGVDKWITRCGREWDRVPEPHQECSHLECAIVKANIWKLYAMASVFFGSIAAISLGITARGAPRAILLITISFAVMAIICLVLALDEKKFWDELNEFKNNGSIKGIKAWQIFEDIQFIKPDS